MNAKILLTVFVIGGVIVGGGVLGGNIWEAAFLFLRL